MKERVVLNIYELELAEMMGMTPAEYGTGKLKLQGARDEREIIVAWLRTLASPENGFLPQTLANWIADEMHHQ
jgi:hypothetical protein